MDQPPAYIRPYVPDDRKLALFMVSKANFQALAVANNKAYRHPLVIAVWLAFTSMFIQSMNWWPATDLGWLGYLKPFPAVACVAVPILFAVDWINRPYFEDLTQEILRFGDLKDIENYYSKSPASGFWILESGQIFVGLIAIDATQPSKKTAKGETAAPRTAVIRHFHVEEVYHKTGIQDDLLKCAVDHAFKNDPKLERIEASDSPLVSYLRPSLRAAGFELDHHTKTIGVLRWKLGKRYLERSKWEEKNSEKPT